jgi:hypothetical protein
LGGCGDSIYSPRTTDLSFARRLVDWVFVIPGRRKGAISNGKRIKKERNSGGARKKTKGKEEKGGDGGSEPTTTRGVQPSANSVQYLLFVPCFR